MTNDGGGSDDGLHIACDAATIMAYTCRGYVDNESIMGWFGRERAIFFLYMGKAGWELFLDK
jgi:hypothetical protein